MWDMNEVLAKIDRLVVLARNQALGLNVAESQSEMDAANAPYDKAREELEVWLRARIGLIKRVGQ